jgi:hypothetical protein
VLCPKGSDAIAEPVDAICQFTLLNSFYPLEALIIAILLALVSYMIFRGQFARTAGWWLADAMPG